MPLPCDTNNYLDAMAQECMIIVDLTISPLAFYPHFAFSVRQSKEPEYLFSGSLKLAIVLKLFDLSETYLLFLLSAVILVIFTSCPSHTRWLPPVLRSQNNFFYPCIYP